MIAPTLEDIAIDRIDRNPENPRIVFRPEELSQLMESIRRHGVQVPIAVFKDGKRYVLIDGERRWRCSIKLNKTTIPAIVQKRPDPLTNLLLMFNIHALREQWDLLTIALKLPRVFELLRNKLGKEPSERDIAAETGLSVTVVRRCKLLIDLPEKHQQTILKELQKPKPQQKLSEDFYIEMERSLKTVERNMPTVITEMGKEAVRETLIQKYRSGTINNLIHFRQVGKIARAEKVDADPARAEQCLRQLFKKNDYSIERAYAESVSGAYGERDLVTRVTSLTEQLKVFEPDDLDDDAVSALRKLYKELKQFLGTL
jgi:ParB family transcriptional regulator, chromosome partitioning protein